jgi:hypothetical protein
MTIDALQTMRAELAEASRLLREAFPKGILREAFPKGIGLRVSDAAGYAPELCGWVYRNGRWPTIEEVRAHVAAMEAAASMLAKVRTLH